ncbi:MAG TPA: hypothetical protein IAB58_00930 [Candidatus Pelethosoma merdigallinarum]|nr:hypothetical protein [Candidatus Pelethosoma merdigallinarum]
MSRRLLEIQALIKQLKEIKQKIKEFGLTTLTTKEVGILEDQEIISKEKSKKMVLKMSDKA